MPPQIEFLRSLILMLINLLPHAFSENILTFISSILLGCVFFGIGLSLYIIYKNKRKMLDFFNFDSLVTVNRYKNTEKDKIKVIKKNEVTIFDNESRFIFGKLKEYIRNNVNKTDNIQRGKVEYTVGVNSDFLKTVFTKTYKENYKKYLDILCKKRLLQYYPNNSGYVSSYNTECGEITIEISSVH